jgi:hypothetical protein
MLHVVCRMLHVVYHVACAMSTDLLLGHCELSAPKGQTRTPILNPIALRRSERVPR